MEHSDSLLLEVIARELERRADADGGLYGPSMMMAQLIRTVGPGVAVNLAPERSVDSRMLKRYLVDKGLLQKDANIEIGRSALGFSKDTYLINVQSGNQDPTTLVIRRNQPAGTTRTSVTDEYPLLLDLFKLGFPVAEPLLVEPERDVLGQPFMLSRGVPGEPDFATTESNVASSVARQLAEFLAQLHRLDANSVAVRRAGESDDPADEVSAYIAEWRDFWEEHGPPGYEDMLDAFDRISGGLPDLDRMVVVHSDVGFHNILIEDGRITAVVDWEFAHLGEAEEDLAYCRDAVEALVPWETFLSWYIDAGGVMPSTKRLADYSMWRGLRNAVCCAMGRSAFNEGLNNDLRLAFAGRIILQASVDSVRKKTFESARSDGP